MDTLLINIAFVLGFIIVATLTIVLVRRLVRRESLVTQGDWLFLFGHSRKEIFSVRYILKAALFFLLFDVLAFAVGYFGILWGGGLLVAILTLVLIVTILFLAPRWMR